MLSVCCFDQAVCTLPFLFLADTPVTTVVLVRTSGISSVR